MADWALEEVSQVRHSCDEADSSDTDSSSSNWIRINGSVGSVASCTVTSGIAGAGAAAICPPQRMCNTQVAQLFEKLVAAKGLRWWLEEPAGTAPAQPKPASCDEGCCLSSDDEARINCTHQPQAHVQPCAIHVLGVPMGSRATREHETAAAGSGVSHHQVAVGTSALKVRLGSSAGSTGRAIHITAHGASTLCPVLCSVTCCQAHAAPVA